MDNFYQAMCDEEVIVSRYADLEWTDNVSNFECASCGRVLIQHYIANCQHKFCLNCHNLVGNGNQKWKCPFCHDFITTIDRQDFEFREQVYQLGVHCLNRKYGCHHTGPLKELIGHMDKCKHTREKTFSVPYLGQNSPQMLDELLELRTEVREMKQMMAQIEKRWNDKDIEGKKDLVDVNIRINGISSKLEVENNMINAINSELKKHESKILKLDVKSELLEMNEKSLQTEIQNVRKLIENQDENFRKINNSIEVMEKNLKESKEEIEKKVEKLETDTENLIIEKIKKALNARLMGVPSAIDKIPDDVPRLTAKLTKVEAIVETLNVEFSKEFPQNKTIEKLIQLTSFNLVEPNSTFSPDFQWKISGINKNLEQSTLEFTSEMFQWAKYPIRARAKLKVSENDCVSMSLCIEKHNPEVAMDLTVVPKIYYVLRDQSTTGNPQHKCIKCSASEYFFSTKFDYSLTFNSSILHKSLLTNFPYNVDDTIAIDIYVEPPMMARKAYSYNGTLEWNIDHFRRRKLMQEEEVAFYQESPYFYTGTKGYRVQVRMYLDYVNEVLARVNFLRGEFDVDLSADFSHRTTVTLFDRKEPQGNITKTVEKELKNKDWYIITVCSKEEMEILVENDTLYCRVTIEEVKDVKEVITPIEKKKTF